MYSAADITLHMLTTTISLAVNYDILSHYLILGQAHLLVVSRKAEAKRNNRRNTESRQTQVDTPSRSVTRSLALRVQVRRPNKRRITEGVVHCQADGSLLAGSGSNVGHPGIGYLQTAVGSRQHEEEGEVPSAGVRCGDGDDDADDANESRPGDERRPCREPIRVPGRIQTNEGCEDVGRCREQQCMNRAEAELLNEGGQKVGQRRHGLDTDLAEDAHPDSVVLGRHLESTHSRHVFFFSPSIFDESDGPQRLFFGRQPFGCCRPVGDCEAGGNGEDNSGCAFDDEEPAPRLNAVVFERSCNAGGEEAAKGTR